MKLGGATLAEPIWDYSGYEKAVNDVGAVHEMADGRLIYDHVGSRASFVLRWVGLTNAEKTAIYNRYLIKTVQTFQPPNYPDEAEISVIVVPKSWREAYIEIGGARRYRVEMALEAQQAS